MEKPVDADEVSEDAAEDVSLEDAEELAEPEEVTLDTLVTQFIQGKSICSISISLVVTVEDLLLYPAILLPCLVEETETRDLYTMINEQKIELCKINQDIRQVSVPFLLHYPYSIIRIAFFLKKVAFIIFH